MANKETLIRTLKTAPWGSSELADACEAMMDLGCAHEAEQIIDYREGIEWEEHDR